MSATVDTLSQEFMHQCLVRQVLALRHEDQRTGTRAKDFLDAWEHKHKTPQLAAAAGRRSAVDLGKPRQARRLEDRPGR